MTVDMLAEAIHKNRATIYRYENNEIKSIPLVDLEPLANALGLDPMYLGGISADPRPRRATDTNPAPSRDWRKCD